MTRQEQYEKNLEEIARLTASIEALEDERHTLLLTNAVFLEDLFAEAKAAWAALAPLYV